MERSKLRELIWLV